LATAAARLSSAKSNIELEKNNYRNSLSSIKAAFDSAKSSLLNSESKYKRKQELYNNKLLSLEQLETAENEYITAKSKFEQALADSDALVLYPERIKIKESEAAEVAEAYRKAEISLEEAKERKRETRIFAPISGVILKREVSAGQIISSGISNVGGGTLLFSIADLSKLYVTASIDESDIGKIKPEQEANISVDAFPRIKFKGAVEWIAPRGETVSNVTIFKVKINITDERRKMLKPGMSASVDITIAQNENVLYAPVSAIKEKDGKSGVYLKEKNGALKWVKARRGVSDGTNVEIIGELKEGDEILVSSLDGEYKLSKDSGAGSNKSNRSQNRQMRMMMPPR